MLPSRNCLSSISHRFNSQHAHHRPQRFPRFPGGRRGRRGADRPSPNGQSSVRFIRDIHDLVREHNHQFGAHVFIGGPRGQFRISTQRSELPIGPRTVPTLRFKRSVDFRECCLRVFNSFPLA